MPVNSGGAMIKSTSQSCSEAKGADPDVFPDWFLYQSLLPCQLNLLVMLFHLPDTRFLEQPFSHNMRGLA
jgi:hypothetical protein